MVVYNVVLFWRFLMPALPPTSAEQTLADLLTARAKSAPDTFALLAHGRPPLFYKQLLTQIQDVGSVLSAWGIGRHDRVAIVVPNGPEMALTFLAVSTWTASAPLNQAYQAEEFDFYLADLNTKTLIILADEDS